MALVGKCASETQLYQILDKGENHEQDFEMIVGTDFDLGIDVIDL